MRGGIDLCGAISSLIHRPSLILLRIELIRQRLVRDGMHLVPDGSAATDNTGGRVTELTTSELTRNQSYDFSVLIIDTTSANGPYYMVAGTRTGMAYDSVQGDEVASIAFCSDQFGTGALTYNATPAANGWAVVPEPTSGLLMLLGMTGLALRRKRM